MTFASMSHPERRAEQRAQYDEESAEIQRTLDALQRAFECERREKAEADAAKAEVEAKRQARFAKREAAWQARRLEQEARDKASSDRAKEHQKRYFAAVTQPDGFGMTCGKCGHLGNFDDFTHDKLGFVRPLDVFQCPACSFAIRREAKECDWKPGHKMIVLTPIQPTL